MEGFDCVTNVGMSDNWWLLKYSCLEMESWKDLNAGGREAVFTGESNCQQIKTKGGKNARQK